MESSVKTGGGFGSREHQSFSRQVIDQGAMKVKGMSESESEQQILVKYGE